MKNKSSNFVLPPGNSLIVGEDSQHSYISNGKQCFKKIESHFHFSGGEHKCLQPAVRVSWGFNCIPDSVPGYSPRLVWGTVFRLKTPLKSGKT